MEPADRLKAIGIEEGTIQNILKNKKVTQQFMEVLDIAGITECPKAKGALLYAVTTKVKPLVLPYMKHFVQMVIDEKWTRVQQLDEGIKWLEQQVKTHGGDSYQIDMPAWESATGVGINVTEEMIAGAIDKLFEENAAKIQEEKHDFNFALFRNKIKDVGDWGKWADGGLVGQAIDKKKLALLGEAPAKEDGKKKKKVAPAAPAKKEEAKEEEVKTIDIKDLIGRDVDTGNSSEHLAKHNAFTGGRVMTRFPPEPNGYLHIGHAKSIRFNFTVAKEYGGETYLRFDDTNPCKENNEFIDHIKEIVAWLGFKPWKTTASSDYFDELYQHAVNLIKKGLAFVDFSTAAEMKKAREEMTDSPWRNSTVEENLKRFERMRSGYYAEGECCLRAKMDMKSPNTVMRDMVMYRVRFVDHPHSGDKWCIYPTYDYTHGMVDSMENITHSLCTLEFEVRRECYYWFLKQCDMWKPMVWEFGRLNMSNTVLSKRKIENLVYGNYVKGWSDPRLHTIQGLKRRGYTPSIILTFCEAIGVTRNSNETLTSYKLLEHYARQELDRTAPRTFGICEPILLEITNFDKVTETKIDAPLFPIDPTKGHQTYTVTKNIFIEADDFSEEAKAGFFGIMPDQIVCLRYGPFVKMQKVVKEGGKVTKVLVEVVDKPEGKVKGVIHWVSKEHSVPCVINQYNVLFTVEDVIGESSKQNKDYLEFLNPESLIVRKNARVWDLQKDVKPYERFQFERVGYFCCDEDSTASNIVFNSIVALKESAAKKGGK